MKRKRLALLLAVAMTVTSLDSTALAVSGADFSSEVVAEAEDISEQTEAEGLPTAEDADVETFDNDEDFVADAGNETGAEVQTESNESDVEISTEEADIGDGEISSDIEMQEDEETNPSVESISITPWWNTSNSFTLGFDTYSSMVVELSVTYTNEQSWKCGSGGTVITDKYGYKYRPVWEKDGVKQNFDYTNPYLPEGDYILRYEMYDPETNETIRSSNEIAVQVTSVEDSEYYKGTLAEGDNIELTTKDNDIFSFVPPSSGKWAFVFPGISFSPSVTVIYQKEDGSWNTVSGDNTIFELTENVRYYLRFNTALYDQNVRIVQPTAVSSVTVDTTNVRTNFYANIESTYLTGSTLTVNYENGETETVELKNNINTQDSYGNLFSYKFIEEEKENETSYTKWAGSFLNAGTYKVIFTVNGEALNLGSDFEYKIAVTKPDPKELTNLQTGVNKDIYSPNGEYRWYCYTPERTGKYLIGSHLTTMMIYYEDEKGNMSRVNDQWGSKGRICKFTEGVTYYIGLSGSAYDPDEGEYVNTFDLSITNSDITELSYSESEITLLNGIDVIGKYDLLPVGSLTIKHYETEETIIPCLGIDRPDQFGNTIHTKLVKDDKEYTFKTDDEGEVLPLPIGVYTLSFVYSYETTTIESKPVTLTVRNPETKDFAELKIGERNENVEYVCSDGMTKSIWYFLKITEAGTYKFQTYEDDSEYEEYTYINWQKIDENGVGNAEGIKREFNNGFYIPAGNYLVKLNAPNEYSSRAFDLDISKIRGVVSTEIVSCEPVEATYVANLERAALDSITVKVTYDDGTTQEYSLEDEDGDEEGRCVYYSIYRKVNPDEADDYDEDYTEAYNEYLDTDNDYIFRVFFGSTTVKDIPITVKSIEESVSAEINTGGTTDVDNQKKLILKYVASDTGRYEFVFNIPVDNLEFTTIKGKRPQSISKDGDSWFANLEADTTYYLYVDTDEYYEKLQVSVSMVTRPVKLAAKALKTDYLAGVEGFDYDSVETKVDYSNNTTGTVRGRGSASGYTVNYRLENENGERYWGGDTLTPGTWTVTPYLSAETTSGSSVAVDTSEIPVESATVTAGLTDLSKFAELKESKWTDFPGTDGEDVYYSFTPSKNSEYTWETKDGRYGFNLEFYRQGEDRYESLGSDIADLNAGEKYLVRITTSYDKQGRIIPYEGVGSEVETVSELTLEAGMNKVVAVGDKYSNDWQRYIKATFIPAETAFYRIETSPWGDTGVDTAVSLYDENGKYIIENDDGGLNQNFALSYQLERGKTYTYRVYAYTSTVSRQTTPFVLHFNEVEHKVIKSVGLVSADGSDASSLYALRDVRAFYNMKVTYADDEAKIYGLEDIKDAYGNIIYVDIPTVDDVQGDFNCKVVLRYGELTNNMTPELTEYETSVPVKGLHVVEQLEEGKEYSSQVDEYKEYVFTPSDDGEYIYTLENRAEVLIHEVGKYVDGSPLQNGISTDEETIRKQTVTSKSIRLEKGRTYLFDLYAKDSSFVIRKATRKLNGLTLIDAPEQKTCLPGTVNTVSYRGLKVRASYTDGTTEDITYGTPDSSGRYIEAGDIQWLDGKRCRVYAKLGSYRVSFEVGAGSWDNVEEIKNYETKTLKGANSGDVVAVKFVPETSEQYQISVTGGSALPIITVSDSDNMYRNNKLYLQSGKIYYFYICVENTDPQVRIEAGNCQWEEISRTEATCTSDGKIIYRCKKHGDVKEEIITKLDHKWSEWKITPATCIDDGVQIRTCSVGGEEEKQILKATGHTWGEEFRVEPTETTSGKRYHICTNCQEEETIEVLPATGVAAKVDEVKKTLDQISEAIESDNISDDTKKTVDEAVRNITEIDNEELIKDTDTIATINKLEEAVLKAKKDEIGRTETEVAEEFGEVEVKGAALTAATVEAVEGKKLAAKVSVKAADAENAKKYEELPENKDKSVLALNITLAVVDTAHNTVVGESAIQPKAPIQMTVNVPEQYQRRELKLYHIKDEKQEPLAYTLNEDGTKLTFVITALSDFTMVAGKCAEDQHSYGEWIVKEAASCTKEGKKEQICTKCGAVYEEKIAKTEHDYSEKIKDEASTCIKSGYIIWKCSNCDDTIVQYLELAEHQWDEGKVIIPATCTVEGTFRYQCKVCEKTNDTPIAKTAHSYTWVMNKEATCGTEGSRYQECTICKSSGKSEVIKSTGKHNLGAWKVTSEATAVSEGTEERCCTVCGGAKETRSIAKLKATATWNIPANKKLPLKVKQSFQIKVSDLAKGDRVVSWVSSNKKVVTVSGNGKITGKKAGKAVVTATLQSGMTARFTITVQKKDVTTSSLLVTDRSTGKRVGKSVSLKAKKKLTLSTTVTPATSKQKVTYSSSNKKVATVNAKGVIVAKKAGTVTITVKSGKKSVKIKVKVTK